MISRQDYSPNPFLKHEDHVSDGLNAVLRAKSDAMACQIPPIRVADSLFSFVISALLPKISQRVRQRCFQLMNLCRLPLRCRRLPRSTRGKCVARAIWRRRRGVRPAPRPRRAVDPRLWLIDNRQPYRGGAARSWIPGRAAPAQCPVRGAAAQPPCLCRTSPPPRPPRGRSFTARRAAAHGGGAAPKLGCKMELLNPQIIVGGLTLVWRNPVCVSDRHLKPAVTIGFSCVAQLRG